MHQTKIISKANEEIHLLEKSLPSLYWHSKLPFSICFSCWHWLDGLNGTGKPVPGSSLIWLGSTVVVIDLMFMKPVPFVFIIKNVWEYY